MIKRNGQYILVTEATRAKKNRESWWSNKLIMYALLLKLRNLQKAGSISSISERLKYVAQ